MRITQMPEPVVAYCHMAYFVAQNGVQHRLKSSGMGGSGQQQFGLYQRRGIQASRLQGARYQGHAGKHIAGGFFAHRPQTVVGGEVAIGIPHSV